MPENFELINQVKALSGFSPELEDCLKEIAPIIVPHLPKVTDAFYVRLLVIRSTSVFLENHVEKLDDLKKIHLNWLVSLFEAKIDAEFAERMRRVGETHVNIKLPIEFMAGSMSLLNKELIKVIMNEIQDKDTCLRALQAINAVTSLTLIIMQKSYQLWD